MAYESNQSGRMEVYVRPVTGAGGPWQVSASGGKSPRWRHDTRELFYVAASGELMGVPLASGEVFEPGLPVALFRPRLSLGGAYATGMRQEYEVSKDGRFLMNVMTGDNNAAPITVIQHWRPAQP